MSSKVMRGAQSVGATSAVPVAARHIAPLSGAVRPLWLDRYFESDEGKARVDNLRRKIAEVAAECTDEPEGEPIALMNGIP